MKIENATKEQIQKIFYNVDKYVEQNFTYVWTKYVDLGTKIVRLISYSEEYTSLVEKQLTYSLRENVEHFDATIILWKEEYLDSFVQNLSPFFDYKKNMRLRLEMVLQENKQTEIQLMDNTVSKCNPILTKNNYSRIFEARNLETNTYYYGVENLEPEEFIKEGHIFVQMFNKILKTPTANIAHGAVVGVNNNGILFCARGQRGKSTLTVLSMIKGFEYVSDDYLVIEKDGEDLYTYPIYSIITLSPKMYNQLYDELEGTRFVSNNARKDKYVFNIANFHNQFKSKYPIKMCIFPEIVNQEKPSIELCNEEEKARAITQLIHSTVMQMQDLSNNEVALKMFNMVKDFKFYKLNLCPDIFANTEFLREFTNNVKYEKDIIEFKNPVFEDITFDLANVLDTRTGVIYSMNKFATNLYENLKRGVSRQNIISELKSIFKDSAKIESEFEIFVEKLLEKEILKAEIVIKDAPLIINRDFIVECNAKISLIEYKEQEIKELVK